MHATVNNVIYASKIHIHNTIIHMEIGMLFPIKAPQEPGNPQQLNLGPGAKLLL
jgi:hypothetical protein